MLKKLLLATSLLMPGIGLANSSNLDDVKVPEYKEGITACVVSVDGKFKLNENCTNKAELDHVNELSSALVNDCSSSNDQWVGLNTKEFAAKVDKCNETMFSNIYSTYKLYDDNIEFKNSGDQTTDFMNAFAQQSVIALCEKFKHVSRSRKYNVELLNNEAQACLGQMQQASAFTKNSPDAYSTILINGVLKGTISRIKLN